MNNKKKLTVFIALIVVMIGAALLLAKMILTKETGEFSIGAAISITGSMLIGGLVSYLLSIWKEKRNKKIPEVDERTVVVLKNYFVWTFYIVMIASSFILIILYLTDVETIELGMIFAYQALIYILVAIGAFIAKRIG